jgi:DNA-directed RNA polymerase II subunit RPB9
MEVDLAISRAQNLIRYFVALRLKLGSMLFQQQVLSSVVTMADLWDENGDQDQNDGEDMLPDDEDEEEDLLDMGEEAPQQTDVLLMRFCPQDSSMLYPQEDKRTKSLRYACRLCRYTEPATDQPLVYRNEMKKEVGNILHTVPPAVADDPTLARSHNANCQNCGHHEAVFFQSDTAQSDSLALIFVCCNCNYKWVT